MADDDLANKGSRFPGLALLVDGASKGSELVFGQGHEEGLEQNNGLSQASVQIVVVEVYGVPSARGVVVVRTLRKSICRITIILGEIFHHFAKGVRFVEELLPLGQQNMAKKGTHARRPLAPMAHKIRGIEGSGIGHRAVMLGVLA
jgi:hypothetical protein